MRSVLSSSARWPTRPNAAAMPAYVRMNNVWGRRSVKPVVGSGALQPDSPSLDSKDAREGERHVKGGVRGLCSNSRDLGG
jgi:hypothetical protein